MANSVELSQRKGGQYPKMTPLTVELRVQVETQVILQPEPLHHTVHQVEIINLDVR